MNNERNPIVNVWGAYFLLFLLMEYLFELGPKTVYVYAVLIGILALYVLSRLFKKVFVGEDEEKIIEKAKSMNRFYTPEQEKEYGVVGIKIEVIK